MSDSDERSSLFVNKMFYKMRQGVHAYVIASSSQQILLKFIISVLPIPLVFGLFYKTFFYPSVVS
jgi:hypothetical protein